jgi:transcription initiation factor IIE alpha subunit
MLELLWHALRTKMNSNALKIILIVLVYSNFISFMASVQHIKLSKYTKYLWGMSSMGLYYNHCVLELFLPDYCTNMNTNTIKIILSLLMYSSFISFLSYFNIKKF